MRTVSSPVRRAFTLGAFALVAVVSPAAFAQRRPPPPAKPPADMTTMEAKRDFDDGATAYGMGNYEEAIRLWEKAYQLSGKALILDNLANACEKLGDLRRTRDYLGRWRAAAPPEEQPMLDARLRTLDARIAREDEATRKAAEEKAARDAQAQAVVAHENDRSWLPGTIVAGVGGLAVIAGVTVDIVANGKRPPSSACAKSPAGVTLCQSSSSSAISSSNRMAIAGDVTWIVGAAAVAAGVTLVLVKRPRDSGPPAPGVVAPVAQPAAWLAPFPGGASLSGRF